ncbi:MAG: hypothetical protein AAB622_02400 [Patescibacteria group bacterium]
MISHKNMILVLATVAVFGAVAVSIFSMRQLAYQKSSDLDSIEVDLNSTNLDNLDKESSEIQTLLN